jgi:hypothetical protein
LVDELSTLRFSTTVSLPFFKDLVPDVKIGEYKKSDIAPLVQAVVKYADSFVAINAKYTPPNVRLTQRAILALSPAHFSSLPALSSSLSGHAFRAVLCRRRAPSVCLASHLVGQIPALHRSDRSALRLTQTPPTPTPSLRSFAATLSSYDRRSGLNPKSWGANKIKSSKTPCQPNPVPLLKVTFKVTGLPATFPAADSYPVVIGQLPVIGGWVPSLAPKLQRNGNDSWSSECTFSLALAI